MLQLDDSVWLSMVARPEAPRPCGGPHNIYGQPRDSLGLRPFYSPAANKTRTTAANLTTRVL